MLLTKLIAIRSLGALPTIPLGPTRPNRNHCNGTDHEHLNKCIALLAALLINHGSSAMGGEVTAPAKAAADKTVIEKKPEANPLCFLDGKICFDIQERFRFEARNNTFDFNDSVNALNDDSFVLNRFRIGMAIKPVDWLKIYAQGQDAHEWLSDRPSIPGALGAEGDDNFDLRQAYIQVGPKSINATLGRQTLAYGDERLIGISDWNNFSRTFDAAKLHYEQGKFSVDLFASTVVYIFRDSFDQSDLFNGSETHRDQVFSGIYGSTTAVNPLTIDLYALLLDAENPTVVAPAITYPGTSLSVGGTRTDFVTLGTRIKADPKKLNGWEYEGEFAFQTGQVSDLDLTAFAAHIGGGYNFDCPWTPRLWAEYNYASGDNNATDGDIETFQNLFPSNHKFYGYMDLFSWQNLHNPELSFRVKPTKQTSIQVDGHGFWLADTSDAWYRANGTTRVRPITPGARNYVGSEIDLTASYQPVKFLILWAGYSHFFAGDYLRDTGPSDDADFGYVQATFSF
jgi:Alginate export